MTLFYTYVLIEFHQNLGKRSFSIAFIGFYQNLIEISSKKNQKRFKMIKKIGIGTEFRSFLHVLKQRIVVEYLLTRFSPRAAGRRRQAHRLR